MNIDFSETNTLLFIVFISIVFIQLLFIFIFYLKLTWIKSKKGDNKPPVSVIICARNEAKNLVQNLPLFLNQNYDKFEVIVVNDSSTDNSDRILTEISAKYSNLKISKIEPNFKFTHGKKLAVTVGIKAASNEWLLFSDADCKPKSKNWISSMANNFVDKHSFVLGYSSFISQPSLLNNFIRYSNFVIGVKYLGFASSGIPYMGVGRNMAYRKSTFNSSKGFTRHLKLLSGDDDLFVNDNANKKNTCIEISKESIIKSKTKQCLKSFWRQKKRHLTTGAFYKSWHKLLIGFESTTQLLTYFGFIFMIYKSILSLYTFIIFASYMVIKIIIFSIIARRLNEKYVLFLLPVWDVLIPFFNSLVIFSNKFSNNKQGWK